MYTFLKIFIVVLIVLAVADWIAGRPRTNVTNLPSGWSLVSNDIKLRSAMANESPEGTAPVLDETLLPGDIKYESPEGNVRIYFPIVTALALSIVVTLILGASRRA